MAQGAPSSFPAWQPAKQARALLSEALGPLQREGEQRAAVARAIECMAGASSALYDVEMQATSAHGSLASIRIAVEQLGEALSALQKLGLDPALEHTTETLARTLALLYPVARGQQRQRREVVYAQAPAGDADGAGSSGHADRPSNVPLAPEPTGRPRRRQSPFDGGDKRSRDKRAFLEVDIGLSTESHFYTGLSLDLSAGGVFVATYQPQPPGTHLWVYFSLPDGQTIEAAGIVRWTRAGSDDSPPGMGVRFSTIEPAALAAIERFCAERAPLYYDADD